MSQAREIGEIMQAFEHDWVEARVIELGGKPDSSPESRKLRIQARKEWADAHN